VVLRRLPRWLFDRLFRGARRGKRAAWISERALVDAAGTEHVRAARNPRIVCLVPSITELLCDLGLAPALVGRTGFLHPSRELVRRIPKLGGTKDVDLDKLRSLAPTHVIVNIDENRKEDAHALAGFVPSGSSRIRSARWTTSRSTG